MNKDIFFHVGLSKTASTYLQNRFFNKLKGINYIGNHNYKKYQEIIENSKDDKLLVSREFDRQFDQEVEKFAKYYPDAKVIIVLRRHDSWMASQYRRFVKNGGTKEFEQFFDVQNDNGLWAVKDALFYPKLKKLDELFSTKPLVIFYDEIKNDILGVFDKIAKFTGTTYNKENINLTSKHKSYSEKQLKFLKKVCVIFKNDYRSQNYLLSRGRWLICHLFLYIAVIIPHFLFSKKPLINPDTLNKVKEHLADDWQKCKSF